MAKRRRLELPDISKLATDGAKEGLESRLGPMSAPIAKVVAETADNANQEVTNARINAAKFEGDAKLFAEARDAGLIAELIDLVDIDPSYIARDRTEPSSDGMSELVSSIKTNGLRLPIEVVDLRGDKSSTHKYGLISGWRRLSAYKILNAEGYGFGQIPAFIRMNKSTQSSFVAMVEENEIREDLSPYERGRIAQLAVDTGAYADLDAAVNALFEHASKAKRSKIRSFALIFRELGDTLSFPTELSERSGLDLALALKDGKSAVIKKALNDASPHNFEGEMKIIKQALASKVSRAKPEVKSKTKLDFLVAQSDNKLIVNINGAGADSRLKAALEMFLSKWK